MSVAAALTLYCLIVIAVGPRLLTRLTDGGDAPRFAVAAWLTAILSVLIGAVTAVALVTAEVAGHLSAPDQLLVSCVRKFFDVLVGRDGPLLQLVFLLATGALGAMTILFGVRMTRALAGLRHRTFAHAAAVRLVGRPIGDHVIVVDSGRPAAYCVVGQPSAIVVTTGAMQALAPEELAAVLAHEQAHLAGRHYHLLTVLRALSAVAPHITLITQGERRIATLLEMCADDQAARRHSRKALLSGLVALSGAAQPAHALAAAGVSVLARAERLASLPTRRGLAQARLALSGAVAIMGAAPLAVVALVASGALICAP